MTRLMLILVLVAISLAAVPLTSQTTIDFEAVPAGTIVDTQYAGSGVTFSHVGALSGIVVDLSTAPFGLGSLGGFGSKACYVDGVGGATIMTLSPPSPVFELRFGHGMPGTSFSYTITATDTNGVQVLNLCLGGTDLVAQARIDVNGSGTIISGSPTSVAGYFFGVQAIPIGTGGTTTLYCGGTTNGGLGAPLATVTLTTNGSSPGIAISEVGVGTPQLPGTGDDLRLGLCVNGAECTTDVRGAVAGDAASIEFWSPAGTFDGGLVAVFGQAHVTGASIGSVPGFPELHFDLSAPLPPMLLFETLLVPGGTSIPFTAPLAPGLSAVFQAVTISPLAGNGIFGASDAKILDLL